MADWSNHGTESDWCKQLGFQIEVAGYTKGYLRPDSGVVWDNFTGQHRTFIKDVPFSQASNLEGLIVSSDQNKYIKMSGGIEAGSNAITTNESLPIVSLSNVVTDKKCFGVISASEDPETRQDRYGNIISVSVKEKGDTRVYINSVGEGAIWVSNISGSWSRVITSQPPTWWVMVKNRSLTHSKTIQSPKSLWIVTLNQ